MLTIKQIRDDKQAAIRKLAKKGVDAAPVIARIETLDDRLKLARELENIDDGEEVILFKDKSGKLVWVRLNGEKWL